MSMRLVELSLIEGLVFCLTFVGDLLSRFPLLIRVSVRVRVRAYFPAFPC
jgi:hypothetical protein